MINEDWEGIGLQSVESLIDADVTEGKTMEFKRQLSPDTTSHKAKFLGEVTSFANDRGIFEGNLRKSYDCIYFSPSR